MATKKKSSADFPGVGFRDAILRVVQSGGGDFADENERRATQHYAIMAMHLDDVDYTGTGTGSRPPWTVCRTLSTNPMESPDDHFKHERNVNDMMTEVALRYLDLGYRPIPLIPGTKRSWVKWAVYRARPPTENEVRSWFGCGSRDIALLA